MAWHRTSMSLLSLYLLFLKIGCFTFGGGYAMIPLFQDELVNRHGLLTTAEFADIIALAQMTPGPVGLNAATYIGQQQAGIAGALAATLGVCTPSLTIVLAVAGFLRLFRDNPHLKAALAGIRPATLGLIAAAVLFFAETSVFAAPLRFLWTAGKHFSLDALGCLIFAGVLAAHWRWKPPFLWVLFGSAALSAAVYGLKLLFH